MQGPSTSMSQVVSSTKVLFVCLGNICRSPTGEAILKKIVKHNNKQEHFIIQSAGTGNYHVGEQPDPRTRHHGEKRGLVFESLAQQFNPKIHFEYFDHILCMDESNYNNILKLDDMKVYHQKVKTIMSFAPHTGYTIVPDPYMGGPSDFELVIDLLEVACQSFYDSL